MKYWLAMLAVVALAPASQTIAASDRDAIEQLLVDSYIEGLFANRDEAAVRRGFHPDFVLHILDDGELVVAPLDRWLERLDLDGGKSESQWRHRATNIDITGDAATARVEVFENDKHIYTDYFGFYRFDSGWLIVNKIFAGHE